MRPPRRSLSAARPLRWWLAWRFAWMGLLPLLLVAVSVVGLLLRQVHADIERHQVALARAISGEVDAHLSGARRELLAIAAYLGQQRDRSASLWFGSLDAHAGTGEVFAAIYVADANDTVLAVGLPEAERAQRPDLIGIDLSRWAMVHAARQNDRPAWSEVFLSVVSARLTVGLTVPMGDRLLIGEVAIDRLSDFLGNLLSDSAMLVMVLDRKGEVIASSQRREASSLKPIVADAGRSGVATREFTFDGSVFIGTAVSAPRLGWTVVVAQPRIEAYQPLWSILWVMAAGGLLALLLATTGTTVLARVISRRVGRYTEQVHAIAEGDYERPWPESKIREFDALADDLGRMSSAIREREQDLARSEARYRSVIDNAPLVIFQFDAKGRLSLNEGKALDRIGLLPVQALGLSLFELYRAYPEVCANARRAIAGETVHFLSQLGEAAFETCFTPVPSADARVQVIGVAVDVTQRIRAEEGLRQANLVVENSPAILFRWLAEPGWPVTFVSHNVVQIGYSADEFLSGEKVFADLVHPDDLPRLVNEVASLAGRGVDRFEKEYRLVTRDGGVRWVDDRTIAERDERGNITHYQGIVIDISERKAADHALRQSELLLRRSQEIGELGSYAYDLHNQTWLSSEKLDQLLGIGASFLKTGKEALSLVAMDDRDALLGFLDEQMAGRRQRFEREFRVLRHDTGEERWLRGLGELECDERGEATTVIGTVRDITQSRRAEQALQESEARYRLLFDANPHPMWVVDLDSMAFLTVNDAALARYGYTRDEFLRMTSNDLALRDETPLLAEDVVAVEEGVVESGFWRHVTKDGSLIDVEMVSHPLSFQGRPALLVLANDITERLRAERALLQSELKYRELVEKTNSIILRWRADGAVTFINDYGLSFFGYPEHEVLGCERGADIVPVVSGFSDQGITTDSESFAQQVRQHRRRDGEYVWVAWTNKAIVDDAGRIVELFSVGSDITERVRTEEQLRQYREHLEDVVAERTGELQQANEELRQAMAHLVQSEKLAALGNLVAGVAHELNTPLGNARLVASLLAQHLRKFAIAVESDALTRADMDTFVSRGQEAVDLLERNAARAADLVVHF
ncbi:MAG: PAS domain S-box protein, partial [Elusimicrobia bacterium]